MRVIAGGMEQRRLAVAQITGEIGNRRQQPRAPWQAAPCLQNVDRNIAVQQGADRSRIPKHHHFDLKPGPLQAVGQVARDPFDASFAEMIEQDRDVWTFHRSEEHTSELQSLMRISYAVFCLKNKTQSKKQ